MKAKPKAEVVLIGSAVWLYVANWLAVAQGWQPFLYCLVAPIASKVYEPLAFLATLMAAFMFAITLVQQKVLLALSWAAIMVLVASLPQTATTLFKLGGACE